MRATSLLSTSVEMNEIIGFIVLVASQSISALLSVGGETKAIHHGGGNEGTPAGMAGGDGSPSGGEGGCDDF